MMIQKFLPDGAKKSSMHYEVYRNKHSSQEDFDVISKTYAKVMGEDKVLCNNAQKNINTGVYVTGQLHPKHEKAPIFIQGLIREAVNEHFKRERMEGREIWPARQQLPANATVTMEDVEICQGIACGVQNEELLAW
jgi:hypothetical protein